MEEVVEKFLLAKEGREVIGLGSDMCLSVRYLL